MANKLLTTEEIYAELGRLAEQAKITIICHVGDTSIDVGTTSVSYSTAALLLPLEEFSNRILVPLVGRVKNTRCPEDVPRMDDRRETMIVCTCDGLAMGTAHGEGCPAARWRPEDVRGETHGDYSQMASVVQTIKAAMHAAPNWNMLNAGQKEALDLTATKIGRIVCGDPNHKDHWADIAGYANLVNDRIGVPPRARTSTR